MAAVLALCVLVILQGVQGGDEDQDGCRHVGDCPVVDNAIEYVDETYSDHLCHMIRDIHCARHHAVNDEQICGTDGHTYKDHCHFAKARCRQIISDGHRLNVYLHGPCSQSTPAPSTTPVVTDKQPEMTTVTDPPLPTTTVTDLPSTVTPSVHTVMENVFCQQANFISCLADFDIVCGSDGTFYPNRCSLSKAQCKDPSLKLADLTTCHVPDPSV